MRRFDEMVEVKTGISADPRSPGAFIWRGRLYVVRAVVDHWFERRAWWRTVLEATDPLAAEPDLQEEIWRVEASPGRSLGTGVYDLAGGPSWRLVGIAD